MRRKFYLLLLCLLSQELGYDSINSIRQLMHAFAPTSHARPSPFYKRHYFRLCILSGLPTGGVTVFEANILKYRQLFGKSGSLRT